jgi:predicted nucleic acid-binding protein
LGDLSTHAKRLRSCNVAAELLVSDPVGRAFDHLRRNTETEGHAFWPDDIPLLDERLIDRSRILGPKQLTDIYLLALAVKHGGRLVTFDRAIPIAAVSRARPEHLVVI